MNIVAIIPARAGSKRVPGKNTKQMAGQPLIAHTIKTAIDAQCFSRVLVSTDDAEIAEIAERYGAEVPALRSAAMATDEALVVDAVLELLDVIAKEEACMPDAVMLLQPTSPLRKVQSIHRAIELFLSVSPESVVSVSQAMTHPYWCKLIDDNGVIKPFVVGQEVPKQSQDLPPVYQLNGLIYLTHIDTLRLLRSFFSENTQGLVIADPEEVIDIDTPMDWLVAETIFKKNSI